MPKYSFATAATVDEAVRLLNEPEVRSIPLGGGTDIFVALRVNPLWFDRLVDITHVPELHHIGVADGVVSIGAAVTFTQALESELLQGVAPFLACACENVGGPAIRNSGTLGGNVANAAACADSLPALVCLDAVVHLLSPAGERALPISEFVSGPHQTNIQPGELITHFSFAQPPAGARSAFIKIGRRRAQSISRLSIAAIGTTNAGGAIDYIRITPGAATPKTIRFTPVEDMLKGQPPTRELFVRAGEAMSAEMISVTGRRWSTPYKEIALKAITERVLAAIFLQEAQPC
ncbi:MAG: xanthine dehydrogenase family protein subunit M [Anaerolineae bacterium]|nr:xanthine dehydrogenase family protein subunit M [Anaerolineae bacterium]